MRAVRLAQDEYYLTPLYRIDDGLLVSEPRKLRGEISAKLGEPCAALEQRQLRRRELEVVERAEAARAIGEDSAGIAGDHPMIGDGDASHAGATPGDLARWSK